jgi:lipopolysaccharide export system ATP-binding protein
VQDIQDIVAHLRERNIGILITDHNVRETLAITDRAYLLYEGTVLHHGTPESMAADPDVREKYLGRDFELRRASTRALNTEAPESSEGVPSKPDQGNDEEQIDN